MTDAIHARAIVVLGDCHIHPAKGVDWPVLALDAFKGADLFVNVARRVLTGLLPASSSRRTYFVWVGHCNDDDFQRWLVHDAGIGDLDNQIRFIGPRAATCSISRTSRAIFAFSSLSTSRGRCAGGRR